MKEAGVVQLLNRLLVENYDAKKGYQKAAEEIDQPALKGRLMSLAEQRENFKRTIKEEIRDLGGVPVAFCQQTNVIQEYFAQPYLLYIMHQVEQTLEECLQYEYRVLHQLKNLLEQKTTISSTQYLVIGQQENIKVALSDLRRMTGLYYSV